jgi:2'-5' RNA ligase
MTSERLRLFVAVSVPDEALRATAQAIEPVKPLWPEARWVDLASQHVTLKFLGWADDDALGAIATACKDVAGAHSPARVSLRGVDAFPSRKRVRVLWAGLDDPRALLASVAGGLDAALEPLGFPREERTFTPHLTLARFKVPMRMHEPWPEVTIDAAPWTVAELGLWRSHLSPRGARYEVIDRLELRRRRPA